MEKFDDKVGEWTPCGKVKGTNADIYDLQAGHTYQFRVKAVNHEGVSDPLSTKDSTLAKDPFGWISMIFQTDVGIHDFQR